MRRSVTIQTNLPNACFYKDTVWILLTCKFCVIVCFDLIFVLIYSKSSSLRFFSQRLVYRWFQVWVWFFKFKFHNVIELEYSKIDNLAKHIAVSQNLNPSMSTITIIKIKNYLNWSIFELGTEFIFFILDCSYIVDQHECKNNLLLAFYSSSLKGCLFISLEKSPRYVPAKYSETNNTEQCSRRNEKYIFYIHFVIDICIPAK